MHVTCYADCAGDCTSPTCLAGAGGFTAGWRHTPALRCSQGQCSPGMHLPVSLFASCPMRLPSWARPCCLLTLLPVCQPQSAQRRKCGSWGAQKMSVLADPLTRALIATCASRRDLCYHAGGGRMSHVMSAGGLSSVVWRGPPHTHSSWRAAPRAGAKVCAEETGLISMGIGGALQMLCRGV